MGKKGRLIGRVWERKEGLKEKYGKENKVWRKSMWRKGKFEGSALEGKEGLKVENGKERKV